MADRALEREDVQGLAVRGFGKLPFARYLLGEIADPHRARAWLRSLAAQVNTGASREACEALNVAFTPSGLAKLGLGAETLGLFSMEFLDGMTAEHRRRVLGDTDDSAPEGWSWGAPGGAPLDILLLVYAQSPAALDNALEVRDLALEGGGIRLVRSLETAELDDREHFGFRDGVSQPSFEGLGPAPAAGDVRAGELLLGHRNEYKRFTPRPLVPGSADPQRILSPDAEGSEKRDLGRNGTYLVFRQLTQDVHSFWSFCEQATRRSDGTIDEPARVRLAAKLVGRWPGGAPLTLAPESDDPELSQANDFGYFHSDRDGLRCPIGAHIRRANPRDSLDPDPGSRRSVEVNKRHRLLRRGRKYGALLPRPDLLSAGVEEIWRDEDRGLHFIALAANISRQFEFVQHTWINDPRFGGLADQPDPLMSPAPPGGRTFTVQATPVRRRYSGLPRFVEVRGGAYFFLPSVRALRYLATLS